ncbi:MAG: CcmD family protein [Armatimonadota bacterium]|nr:CcmD family protein [Armatimonadota bacterium]MDW8157144.1 CcmD family protein [Armatimonadota bacterium]
MSPWVWVLAAYGAAGLLVGAYVWRLWRRRRELSVAPGREVEP